MFLKEKLKYKKLNLNSYFKKDYLNKVNNFYKFNLLVNFNTYIKIIFSKYFFLPIKKFKISRSIINRKCFLTGRSRSFIRFYNLSKISFKNLGLDGKLIGLQKFSW